MRSPLLGAVTAWERALVAAGGSSCGACGPTSSSPGAGLGAGAGAGGAGETGGLALSWAGCGERARSGVATKQAGAKSFISVQGELILTAPVPREPDKRNARSRHVSQARG